MRFFAFARVIMSSSRSALILSCWGEGTSSGQKVDSSPNHHQKAAERDLFIEANAQLRTTEFYILFFCLVEMQLVRQDNGGTAEQRILFLIQSVRCASSTLDGRFAVMESPLQMSPCSLRTKRPPVETGLTKDVCIKCR